jgi:hypothetical protein
MTVTGSACQNVILKSCYILQSKVEKSLMEMRQKKATINEDVLGNVLILLEEDGLKIMTQLINNIYKVVQI